MTIVDRKIHLYLRVYTRLRPVYAFAGQWLIIFWVFFDAIMLQFTTSDSYCVVICSLGSSFYGVLAGVSLHAPQCCFVTIIFWSVAARTPSSIRYSSFAVPFIFQFSVFRGKQTFISAIAHAMLSIFLNSFGQRLILICDFRHICAYLSGDICTTYTKCVRLRFARTHLSRSEVLACLQLSYCFASIHR